MVDLLGALLISILAGWIVGYASLRVADYLGWWNELELGAVIPMLALMFFVFLVVSASTFLILI